MPWWSMPCFQVEIYRDIITTMSGKYGFSIEKWEEAKEEIIKILIARARISSPISYSDLASQIMTIEIEPDAYALHEMLGEISIDEDNAGRGLLSIFVVHKDGDMMPGQGIFDLAKNRGRDTSDREKFWIEEINFVHSHWK